MNARPQPFTPAPRVTFTAWIQTDAGSTAYGERRFDSLADAERHFAHEAWHGATILILEHDSVTDARTLHSYRIRRGKWAGRFDRYNRKAYPHHADRLFALPVDAFEPTAPFRVTRGCDVVGIDRGLIEVAK